MLTRDAECSCSCRRLHQLAGKQGARGGEDDGVSVYAKSCREQARLKGMHGKSLGVYGGGTDVFVVGEGDGGGGRGDVCVGGGVGGGVAGRGQTEGGE